MTKGTLLTIIATFALPWSALTPIVNKIVNNDDGMW